MANDVLKLLKSKLNYDPITGVFTRRSGTRKVGNVHSRGYLHIQLGKRIYKAHRLAWLWVHGCWPATGIDHINGDKLDNRIANLREADQTLNNRNARRRKDNASGLVGVHYSASRRLWVAQISTDNGRRAIYQGPNFFEACCRRVSAQNKLNYTHRHGEET